jgi:hypothetical protein
MISTGELSERLATLYAAPLEPEKWQVFFDTFPERNFSSYSCKLLHIAVSAAKADGLDNTYFPDVVAGVTNAGGSNANPPSRMVRSPTASVRMKRP